MKDYIWKKLGDEECLCQLAEEAAELCQAALKMRRVLDKTNPTPVTMGEAIENLKEEIADVTGVLSVLGFDDEDYVLEIKSKIEEKLKRWVSRLEEHYGK